MSLPFIFEDKLDIICFEPLTYSYEKLRKNFEINKAEISPPKAPKLSKTAQVGRSLRSCSLQSSKKCIPVLNKTPVICDVKNVCYPISKKLENI